MHDSPDDDQGESLVASRTMDIAVALVLLIGSIVVMLDSIRSGIGWRDDGPAPGFFPFWVTLILAGASAVNLIRAFADTAAASEVFVYRLAFRRVLAVLLPTLAYVSAIDGVAIGPLKTPGLGIYLASAVFIGGFMSMLSDRVTGSMGVRIGAALAVMLGNALVFAAILTVLKLTGSTIPVMGVLIPIPIAFVLAVVVAALPFGGSLGKLFTIGPAVAITLYAMFEIWFTVPLVKGPLEALLGLA